MVFLMSLVKESLDNLGSSKNRLISDASDLLELPIYYTDASKVELSRPRKADRSTKSVVRYDASNSIAYVIIGLRDDPQHYLSIKVDKITERQMKALPIFVLDYLMFYPGRNKNILPRLKSISHIRSIFKTFKM